MLASARQGMEDCGVLHFAGSCAGAEKVSVNKAYEGMQGD